MPKQVAINILSAAKIFAPIKIEDLDEKRIVPKMMLRRRLTRNAKIMLYLADKCGFDGGKIVYGSAFGELQSTVGITDAILNETPISPTLFQNSVYNSAPSYFSLLNSDKDEIITISSGMQTSRVALQTAALQALTSGERVLCVVTECLDINMIEDVNSCSDYLESGVAVVIEIAKDKCLTHEIVSSKKEGFLASLDALVNIVDMFEDNKHSVFVSL